MFGRFPGKIKERSGPEGHRAPEQPSPRTAQNETTPALADGKYNFPAIPSHRSAIRGLLLYKPSSQCANFCTLGRSSGQAPIRILMIRKLLSLSWFLAHRMHHLPHEPSPSIDLAL